MSTSKRPPASTPAPRPVAAPEPVSDSAASEPPTLSTYSLAKLYHLWSHEALTPEQMMGHLLQHQIDQEQRLHRLEQATQVVRK